MKEKQGSKSFSTLKKELDSAYTQKQGTVNPNKIINWFENVVVGSSPPEESIASSEVPSDEEDPLLKIVTSVSADQVISPKVSRPHLPDKDLFGDTEMPTHSPSTSASYAGPKLKTPVASSLVSRKESGPTEEVEPQDLSKSPHKKGAARETRTPQTSTTATTSSPVVKRPRTKETSSAILRLRASSARDSKLPESARQRKCSSTETPARQHGVVMSKSTSSPSLKESTSRTSKSEEDLSKPQRRRRHHRANTSGKKEPGRPARMPAGRSYYTPRRQIPLRVIEPGPPAFRTINIKHLPEPPPSSDSALDSDVVDTPHSWQHRQPHRVTEAGGQSTSARPISLQQVPHPVSSDSPLDSDPVDIPRSWQPTLQNQSRRVTGQTSPRPVGLRHLPQYSPSSHSPLDSDPVDVPRSWQPTLQNQSRRVTGQTSPRPVGLRHLHSPSSHSPLDSDPVDVPRSWQPTSQRQPHNVAEAGVQISPRSASLRQSPRQLSHRDTGVSSSPKPVLQGQLPTSPRSIKSSHSPRPGDTEVSSNRRQNQIASPRFSPRSINLQQLSHSPRPGDTEVSSNRRQNQIASPRSSPRSINLRQLSHSPMPGDTDVSSSRDRRQDQIASPRSSPRSINLRQLSHSPRPGDTDDSSSRRHNQIASPRSSPRFSPRSRQSPHQDTDTLNTSSSSKPTLRSTGQHRPPSPRSSPRSFNLRQPPHPPSPGDTGTVDMTGSPKSVLQSQPGGPHAPSSPRSISLQQIPHSPSSDSPRSISLQPPPQSNSPLVGMVDAPSNSPHRDTDPGPSSQDTVFHSVSVQLSHSQTDAPSNSAHRSTSTEPGLSNQDTSSSRSVSLPPPYTGLPLSAMPDPGKLDSDSPLDTDLADPPSSWQTTHSSPTSS